MCIMLFIIKTKINTKKKKKKSILFTFKKENVLPFTPGAKLLNRASDKSAMDCRSQTQVKNYCYASNNNY